MSFEFPNCSYGQVTCRFVPECCTCDQLSDFHVSSFPEETDQGRNTAAVLQGHFVLIVGFAIHQVPQSSTCATMNLAHPMVQQVDQKLDAPLFADLKIKKNKKKLIFFRNSH